MWGLFFVDGPVRSYADVARSDVALFNRFFHAMLARGVYLAPSAFEAGFLSAAHTSVHVQETLAAADEALAEIIQS
jgi:glutamate-1-semialdehyde 2,1-aminomutase